MSGGAEAFFFFIFPRELPYTSYIHALPDIRTYLNFGKFVPQTNYKLLKRAKIYPYSDILSFYKEELLGECANYMSILATSSRTPKHVVLKNVADETSAAYNRAMETLSSNPKALEAYRKFGLGFVAFHTSLPRYKLTELDL